MGHCKFHDLRVGGAMSRTTCYRGRVCVVAVDGITKRTIRLLDKELSR
jgi:hypothetical protein